MDFQAHKKRIYRHCLAMAQQDPGYALWAAEDYEIKSFGVLEGLHAAVKERITRKQQLNQGNTNGTHPET